MHSALPVTGAQKFSGYEDSPSIVLQRFPGSHGVRNVGVGTWGGEAEKTLPQQRPSLPQTHPC